MSRLILRDFGTGRTYLLEFFIKCENYRLGTIIQPCYTLKAKIQPELEPCQVKLYILSNLTTYHFLGLESNMRTNVGHQHYIN